MLVSRGRYIHISKKSLPTHINWVRCVPQPVPGTQLSPGQHGYAARGSHASRLSALLLEEQMKEQTLLYPPVPPPGPKCLQKSLQVDFGLG